jgi:membrane protein DedA with SNARE-associated domain
MTDLITWLAEHGYPIIFLMLLGSGFGVPVPEDVPLIAAGVLADHGGMSVPMAALACGGFVLARDTFVFTIGYRYGTAVLENRWASRVVSPDRLKRVQKYLEERGAIVVFIGRFVPGFRVAIFFAAGASKVKPGVFLLTDTLAAVLSLPFFIWIGYAFSQNLERIHELVTGYRTVSLSVLAVVLAVALWRWWRAQQAETNG